MWGLFFSNAFRYCCFPVKSNLCYLCTLGICKFILGFISFLYSFNCGTSDSSKPNFFFLESWPRLLTKTSVLIGCSFIFGPCLSFLLSFFPSMTEFNLRIKQRVPWGILPYFVNNRFCTLYKFTTKECLLLLILFRLLLVWFMSADKRTHSNRLIRSRFHLTVLNLRRRRRTVVW